DLLARACGRSSRPPCALSSRAKPSLLRNAHAASCAPPWTNRTGRPPLATGAYLATTGESSRTCRTRSLPGTTTRSRRTSAGGYSFLATPTCFSPRFQSAAPPTTVRMRATAAATRRSADRLRSRRRRPRRSLGKGSISSASRWSSRRSSFVCIFVLLELDPHRAERLVQRRLHGAERAAHRAGDVGEWEVGQVAQHDRLALP